MDFTVINMLFFFIGVPIGLGLMFYFVPKQFGYPKTAKYLTLTYCLLVLSIVLYILLEDRLFSKHDAQKLVEEQKIFLHDEFVIEYNSSGSAPGDFFHEFVLKISDSDKQVAIRTIRSAKGFKSSEKLVKSLLVSYDSNRYFGPKVVQDYETEEFYIREYFEPHGKENYAPTFRQISISKAKNELIFKDIVE